VIIVDLVRRVPSRRGPSRQNSSDGKRSGFGPQLALAYDSGAGNGPFGLGWSLLLPSIARKPEKGLPQSGCGGRGGR
jgi:hypothetical protein